MRWFDHPFRKTAAEKQLDSELRFHLEQGVAENIAAGMSPGEARRRAQIEFGGMEAVKEDCREARRVHIIETLIQDVRYGVRMLRRNPGFTVVAVLTLALVIGANTAIFSLIDAVMLRPLAVQEPGKLLILRWTAREAPKSNGSVYWAGCPIDADYSDRQACSFSYPMFEQIRSGQKALSAISGVAGSVRLRESIDDHLSYVQGEFVSGDFFTTLGVSAALGRTFTPSDDTPGAEPVVLLSYRYWDRHLGRDPSILGKFIFFEGRPFRVAGVTAGGFTGLDPGLANDVWLPLAFASQVLPGWGFEQLEARSLWTQIVVRTKRGVTLAQAESALTSIFAGSAASVPGAIFKSEDDPQVELLSVGRGLTTLRREFSRPLMLLMIAAGIVLLTACANLAGLMTARAARRQKEIALRFSLGASYGRIARQLLTESILIALQGGVLGILIAYWGAGALASFLSTNWVEPLQIDVRPDPSILGFTAAATVLTGILFGLGPIFRCRPKHLTPALNETGQNPQAGSSHFWFGNVLVVAQAALSIVVLVGAGLLVRTLANLESVKSGFDPRNVLLFDVDAALGGYKQPQLQSLYDQLQSRIEMLPGVVSASRSLVALVSWSNMTTMLRLTGASEEDAIRANELPVGTNFFETMRIPLTDGRLLVRRDFSSTAKPEPVVVNESLARRLFGSQNPVGRYLSDFDSKIPDWEIVGVVGDAKYADLRQPIQPTAYEPIRRGGTAFEVRAVGDPRTLIPSVRDAVAAINSAILVSGFRTQAEQIDQTLYQERLVSVLSSLFGLLTLVLVCIGLYGLLSYKVANRTHEIGVRMALGAQPRDILRLIARHGLALLFLGTLLGISVSVGVARFLKSLLYGVKPIDPFTLIGTVILLMAVAILACYMPARRAMRVDPMVALRHE
jgi:predicted permease